MFELANWTVTTSEVDDDGTRRVSAQYDVAPNGCGKCKTPANLYKHGSKKVSYVDLPFQGRPTFIEVRRLRYICRSCGCTFMQDLPDMDDSHRMTRRFREYISGQMPLKPNTHIAKEVGLDEKVIRLIRKELGDPEAQGLPPTPGEAKSVIHKGGSRFQMSELHQKRSAKFVLRMPEALHKRLTERCDRSARSTTSEINLAVQSWLQGDRHVEESFRRPGAVEFSCRMDTSLREDLKSASRETGAFMNQLALSALERWLAMPIDIDQSHEASQPTLDDSYRTVRIPTELYENIAASLPHQAVTTSVTDLLSSAFPPKGDP